MTDPKLKPVYRETTFWVLLALSIPGAIAAYAAAWEGVTTGTFDPESFYATVFALPIVVYLGVMRQFVRKESVRQVGDNLHVINNGYADAYADGFDAAAGFDREDVPEFHLDGTPAIPGVPPEGAEDWQPILFTSAPPPADPEGTHPADAAHPQAEHFVTVTNPATGESFTVPGSVAAAMNSEEGGA